MRKKRVSARFFCNLFAYLYLCATSDANRTTTFMKNEVTTFFSHTQIFLHFAQSFITFPPFSFNLRTQVLLQTSLLACIIFPNNHTLPCIFLIQATYCLVLFIYIRVLACIIFPQPPHLSLYLFNTSSLTALYYFLVLKSLACIIFLPNSLHTSNIFTTFVVGIGLQRLSYYVTRKVAAIPPLPKN